MKERITKYLSTLIQKGSVPIRLQFKKPKKQQKNYRFKEDPLGEEEKYSPVKGIVHKFGNRALWKITYRCAAHCQHCTRTRQIGTSDGDLVHEDILNGAEYIRTHTEIDEVILSGGDPMFTVLDLMDALNELMKIETVKVIRIGTRMPLHSPDSFRTKHFKELLKKMRLIVTKKRSLLVLVHINHPDELTRKVLNVLHKIKKTGAEILTQTVFLKGINDDVEVLKKMCTILYHNRIRPYYIYRCDYVRGLERFIVPLRREKKIMTELRKHLSGPAYPLYVIDLPDGRGKIPPPLDFWKGTGTHNCFDFDGKKIRI